MTKETQAWGGETKEQWYDCDAELCHCQSAIGKGGCRNICIMYSPGLLPEDFSDFHMLSRTGPVS